MAVTTNQRFGRLVVLSRAGLRNGRTVWLCRCDCGKHHEASSKHLTSGGTTSCGCYRSENSKRMRAKKIIPFESRLLKKENGCLEWQGYRDRGGYGTIRKDGQDFKAHRVAYEKAYGAIESSHVYILHKCDNPPCCNPEHLFLGDHLSNMKDRDNKKRQAFGIKNANAKLTDHIVAMIRKMYEDGISQQKIAIQFGVSQSAISRVTRRALWKNVL